MQAAGSAGRGAGAAGAAPGAAAPQQQQERQQQERLERQERQERQEQNMALAARLTALEERLENGLATLLEVATAATAEAESEVLACRNAEAARMRVLEGSLRRLWVLEGDVRRLERELVKPPPQLTRRRPASSGSRLPRAHTCTCTYLAAYSHHLHNRSHGRPSCTGY
jgi:hypothetical protein